jgi:hypothetical protein
MISFLHNPQQVVGSGSASKTNIANRKDIDLKNPETTTVSGFLYASNVII